MMKDRVNGYFTIGEVKGDIITKRIKCNSEDEKIILYEIFGWQEKTISEYYSVLKKSKVKISTLNIVKNTNKEIVLEQNWINGTKLTDWIRNNFYKYFDNMINIFKKLLQYQWMVYEENNKARIDFNLKNFVIVEDEPVLIDFVPPIFVDKKRLMENKNKSVKIATLLELYYRIDWQMTALIGYWIQEILYSPLFEKMWKRENLAELINIFWKYCNSLMIKYKLKIILGREYIKKNEQYIFHKKFSIIYKYVDEIYSLDEVRRNIKQVSIDLKHS